MTIFSMESKQVDMKWKPTVFAFKYICHMFPSRHISSYKFLKKNRNRNIRFPHNIRSLVERKGERKKALYLAVIDMQYGIERKWLFTRTSENVKRQKNSSISSSNWVIITSWSFSLQYQFMNSLSFDELSHIKQCARAKDAFEYIRFS